MILNKTQAHHVYAAMCVLNNVSAKIKVLFGNVAEDGINVFEDSDGVNVVRVRRYDVVESENYANQSDFEMAYELDEATTRAEMVIEGSHPTITYTEIIEYFGLDESFVYTPKTFTPYVEEFVKMLAGDQKS
ncbi:hypothetical protein [Hydrogenophaga sp. NFH-34]|uniref:hypothetical protein n=1 Tax=Hydrogenophaga sp. NFH-34 TaxID=2744446 RepID=UPI001F25024B|nr:hypothetical protein [Hydrogenophaga sp. NFH-34]